MHAAAHSTVRAAAQKWGPGVQAGRQAMAGFNSKLVANGPPTPVAACGSPAVVRTRLHVYTAAWLLPRFSWLFVGGCMHDSGSDQIHRQASRCARARPCLNSVRCPFPWVVVWATSGSGTVDRTAERDGNGEFPVGFCLPISVSARSRFPRSRPREDSRGTFSSHSRPRNEIRKKSTIQN